MDDMFPFKMELNQDAVQRLCEQLNLEPQHAIIQAIFVGIAMIGAEKNYGLKIVLRDESDKSEWAYSVDDEKKAIAIEDGERNSDISGRHKIGNVIYFDFGREEKDEDPT